MNNNTKVIIMAHSMGNLVILYYLNHQPQPWKDKYIQSFITLAAPWGGSLKALKMLVSGTLFTILDLNAILNLNILIIMIRTKTNKRNNLENEKFLYKII